MPGMGDSISEGTVISIEKSKLCSKCSECGVGKRNWRICDAGFSEGMLELSIGSLPL